MKDQIKKLLGLKARSKVIPLTVEEKNDLKDEFWRFMDAHPLPAPKPTSFLKGSYLSLVPQLAVFVLMFSAVGTTYFAEQSEPGDQVLYAIKRNVNENFLLGATSFSPALRAEVDKSLLSRRFVEIEKLIADEAFTDDTAVRLRADISEHTDALNAFVSEAEAEGDLEVAMETSDDLATMLDAHNTVINLLDNLATSSFDEQIDLFTRELEEDRLTLNQRRQVLNGKSDTETQPDHQAEIGRLKEELARINEEWERSKEIYVADTEVAEEIDFLISHANSAYETAEAEIKLGNLDMAVKLLENAVRNTEKANLVLTHYHEALEEDAT